MYYPGLQMQILSAGSLGWLTGYNDKEQCTCQFSTGLYSEVEGIVIELLN